MGSIAQAQIDRISVQYNAGVGISNKPETMFGKPFFLSGQLAFDFKKHWRIAAEGGIVDFRDADFPTQKVGLLMSTYSRYQHGYGGLRVGLNLLAFTKPDELFVSTGANYLLIVEPGVKLTGGFFNGYAFHYEEKRYLNIPVQIDFVTGSGSKRNIRIVFSGRWNFNRYHSFPTISAGINIPVYNRKRTSVRGHPEFTGR